MTTTTNTTNTAASITVTRPSSSALSTATIQSNSTMTSLLISTTDVTSKTGAPASYSECLILNNEFYCDVVTWSGMFILFVTVIICSCVIFKKINRISGLHEGGAVVRSIKTTDIQSVNEKSDPQHSHQKKGSRPTSSTTVQKTENVEMDEIKSGARDDSEEESEVQPPDNAYCSVPQETIDTTQADALYAVVQLDRRGNLRGPGTTEAREGGAHVSASNAADMSMELPPPPPVGDDMLPEAQYNALSFHT